MNLCKSRFSRQFLWLFLALAFPFSAIGQETKQNPVLKLKPEVNYKDSVVTHRLSSKLMAREMSYKVILPVNYKTEKQKNISSFICFTVGNVCSSRNLQRRGGGGFVDG